jgi:hypothetical protein
MDGMTSAGATAGPDAMETGETAEVNLALMYFPDYP